MATSRKPNGELRDIEVSKLHLDPENPRLPERLQGKKETALLAYMVEEETLGELAESLVDNGYFRHEPLLVVSRSDDGGSYYVVEGNRRLATLLVLLDRPVAKGLTLGLDVSKARRAELSSVACRVLSSRLEVEPYVGYRHIGGMKKWPAEAKARYVVDQIEKLAARGDSEPFKTLGRRVGSNARSMRHSYAALRLLRHARDECGFNLQALLDERRFGVWLRAYDSPGIRRYIKLERDAGEPNSYVEVRKAIKRVDSERLVEVLNDFVPQHGSPPIMDDSRDMSVYAAVISHPRARDVMRRRRSLDEARLMVSDEAIAAKVARLARSAETILIEVHNTLPDNELRMAADSLWQAAKALRSATLREVDI